MRTMKTDIRYPISTGHLTLELTTTPTDIKNKKVFRCRPCVQQYWSTTGAIVASLLKA